MTKKTRTILFWLFFLLFILSVPSAILYSQGYRFDFNPQGGGKRFSQTGGLYIKALPKQVEISLNGKFAKKTNFLSGAALVENLLPKKYSVKVSREGYFPWEKNLEIKEKQVTEAKSVALVPQNPKFSPAVKDADNFFFSPDNKKIITLKKGNQSFRLSLFEPEKKLQSLLTEKGGSLESLIWSPDSKRILFAASLLEQIQYYVLDLQEPQTPTSLGFLARGAEGISFNPQNNQEIFFIKNDSLYRGNYITKEIQKNEIAGVLVYQEINGSIYYLENTGFVYKTDSSFSNKEKINESPFPAKNETEYKIFSAGSYLFLKEGMELYILDSSRTKFEEFSKSAKSLVFSPDDKKFAYFNDNEISLFFFKDADDQPQRKAGDKVFISRFSGRINDVFWYTAHYLLFSVADSIKIAEIDDRDRIQIWDLASAKSPQIFFNYSDKKLYFQSEGVLYGSEKLIP